MAFKTFAPGVLTSSDVNTFLMRQAVITCTSSTRPSSPSEGMTIYETDTDLFAHYTGSAWQYTGGFTAFTPTISSSSTGWSIGNGTATGYYARVGDFIFGRLLIGWGSTSTFGGTALDIDKPVNSTGTFYEYVGIGTAHDTSAVNGYPLNIGNGTNVFRLQLQATSLAWTTSETILNTRPFTWASGDYIGLSFFYQAA